MYTALRKVKKGISKVTKKEKEPSEVEKSVAQAIFDLETTVKELKADLAPIYFTAAREVKVSKDKSAIVVFVPVKFARTLRKIQTRLVRELEKKFSGKHVIVVAHRKTNAKKLGVFRPNTKTWAFAKEAAVQDVAFPVEIVGKRQRFNVDGTKTTRVYVLIIFLFRLAFLLILVLFL